MLKTIATLATTAVLIGAGTASAGGNNQYHGPSDKPRWLTTACEQEDSNNCYWDAGSQGDGQGHSFWSIPIQGSGDHWTRCTVLYWNTTYAKHNSYTVDC